MKRGKQIDSWFPLWIDKWIFGSTRHELIIKNPDGTIDDLRGVFLDLMSVSKKDNGFIRANETTPYPMEQLAGMFCIPLDILKKTIEKCLEFGKLSEPSPGIYYLNSNQTYALTDRHIRRLKSKADMGSGKADMWSKNPDIRIEKNRIEKNKTTSLLLSEITASVVSYLNEKTGKKFSPNSTDTIKHISARIAEGRTLDDFKHVIDIKVEQWKGKTWKDARPGREGETVNGDNLLRPSTLFRPGNFENYLNETIPGKKVTPEEFKAANEAELKKLQGER